MEITTVSWDPTNFNLDFTILDQRGTGEKLPVHFHGVQPDNMRVKARLPSSKVACGPTASSMLTPCCSSALRAMKKRPKKSRRSVERTAVRVEPKHGPGWDAKRSGPSPVRSAPLVWRS
ncbi:MAG: hypothetical protein IPO15_14780 [Anaerolineae bacterium]|nr:hypothetical protein [Anaerolineae bacterium]